MKKQIIVLTALLAACDPAFAGGDHDWVRRAVEEGRILPLSQILARAETAQGGQLVEAKLEDEHGALVYEIKMLTPDARLTKVYYDARTGAPMPDKEGRELH